MFVVRSVEPADISAVQRLARALDTVNLPDDEVALEEVLQDAQRSFAGDGESPVFVFALEDLELGRVVGLSMVIARHGTPSDPHHYYKLDIDERYSESLAAVHRHQTLQFKRSFTPHTEIGALILEPEYRGHPAKLGKLLSFSRFLYVAAFRERFCESVQAELLPPFEPDGSSRLWNWLGRKFTGLDYLEADRLSRVNHEFMQSLFPPGFIYTSLMPEEVQAVIGSVGESTRGVAAMLRSIGFVFNNHIDPFDGGPHFEAKTDEITIVNGARLLPVTSGFAADRTALVGHFASGGAKPRIAIGRVAIAPSSVQIGPDLLSAIGATEGDQVWVSPLGAVEGAQ